MDEKELEDQIQVHGSYRKPEVNELAIVQFWFLPYYLCKSVWWYSRWFYKYVIKKEEYTEEDKEFIVRGILNISQSMTLNRNASAFPLYVAYHCKTTVTGLYYFFHVAGTWEAMDDRTRDKIWARALLSI